MATPPTFVSGTKATFSASSGGLETAHTTAAITVSSGDLLCVLTGAAEYDATQVLQIATDSASDTFTNRGGTVAVAGNGQVRADSASFGSSGTPTVTVHKAYTSGSVYFWGGTAYVFRGSDGVGAADKTTGSGGPSLSLTTTADNSAIVVMVCDWNAIDGATRTWRTVNSITPTAGNGAEIDYQRDASWMTVYTAYYSDVGAAGAKTVGLSAPVGQKFSIVAVEIKGAAAVAATSAPPSSAPSRMGALLQM